MFKDGKVTKGTWVNNVLDQETKVVEDAEAPKKPSDEHGGCDDHEHPKNVKLK